MLPAFTLGGWFPSPIRAGRIPMSTISPASTPTSTPAAEPLMVRRAAVLGAGTMGSRIAAHLANAGIPVLLLDLPPKTQRRTRWQMPASKPLPNPSLPLSMSLANATLITPGNFDDDLSEAGAVRLGHRGRRRESRNQDRSAGPRSAASCVAGAAHHQYLRPARRPHRRRPSPATATASSERTSSTLRATCGCSR